MSASPQPKELRSRRAAVSTMRFGAASAGTKTPEKQAEITTTVGRWPQVRSTIAASTPGGSTRLSTRTPLGSPCEVR